MVAIGDVTRWVSGGTPNRAVSEYWEGTIPWISGSTLKTAEISDSDQHLTSEGVAAGSKMAPVGSTLFLVRGSALHNEIRAGLVVAPVCFNQDVKALVPDAKLEPKYLTYSILGRSHELLKLVSSAGNSAGVLDTKLVQAFKIFLPPLKEQRAIATAMSDVDALITTQDNLIVKKRAIRTATMRQLLSGKKRLPGFSGEWMVRRQDELIKCINGRAYRRSEWEKDGVPVVRLQNLTGSGEDYYYSKLQLPAYQYMNKGDLIFMWSASFGPYIWRGGKAIYHYHIWKIECQKVDRTFYYYKLVELTENLKKGSSGSTMAHLTKGGMERYKVTIPCLIDEQKEIGRILSDMDAEITALEGRRDKIIAIKQGMMRELLTGRTRLI